jgi:hypothetical protein
MMAIPKRWRREFPGSIPAIRPRRDSPPTSGWILSISMVSVPASPRSSSRAAAGTAQAFRDDGQHAGGWRPAWRDRPRSGDRWRPADPRQDGRGQPSGGLRRSGSRSAPTDTAEDQTDRYPVRERHHGFGNRSAGHLRDLAGAQHAAAIPLDTVIATLTAEKGILTFDTLLARLPGVAAKEKEPWAGALLRTEKSSSPLPPTVS